MTVKITSVLIPTVALLAEKDVAFFEIADVGSHVLYLVELWNVKARVLSILF